MRPGRPRQARPLAAPFGAAGASAGPGAVASGPWAPVPAKPPYAEPEKARPLLLRSVERADEVCRCRKNHEQNALGLASVWQGCDAECADSAEP
eukprot:1901269-Alexandrium_andersonii.AAC.1